MRAVISQTCQYQDSAYHNHGSSQQTADHITSCLYNTRFWTTSTSSCLPTSLPGRQWTCQALSLPGSLTVLRC